mgnify:CR=1 FL=1
MNLIFGGRQINKLSTLKKYILIPKYFFRVLIKSIIITFFISFINFIILLIVKIVKISTLKTLSDLTTHITIQNRIKLELKKKRIEISNIQK